MDLLLLLDENKSHYVYFKDFNRFVFSKTKNENKKYFCKCCLQCFSCKKVSIEQKENCLKINGRQNVKLGKGSISFKNYSKQLPDPFKVYADFECILSATHQKESKVVTKIMAHTQNKIMIIFLAVLRTKLFALIKNLAKKLLFTEEKMLLANLLKQFLKSINIVKKFCKKHFYKNLIMFAEEKEKF